MENIFEENNVRCKDSEANLLVNPKDIKPIYPFFQMWIMSDDIKVSIYTFPSECLLHKVSKDYENCSYKIHSKSVENRSIEKFCILKLTNFVYYMGYMSNYLSTSSVSALELNCLLNKKFSLFSHYSNLDLIKRTSDPSNSHPKKKMLKVNINKYFDKISDFKVVLNQVHINFIVHAILTLKNFFSRYFLYYSNKNIKYCYFGESQKKRVVVNMKNSNLILRNTLHNTSDMIYELEINLGLSFILSNQGNTWIGPFKDFKTINIFIKKMLLNNVRLGKGKPEVKLSNKILSDFSILIEFNCESTERDQKEGRVYYIYVSKCPKGNDEGFFTSRNNGGKLKNRKPLDKFYNSSSQVYTPSEINLDLRNVTDYRNEIYSLKFFEEEIVYNKKDKESQIDDSEDEIIRTSLIQILQIKMILNNVNECYSKYISSPFISHINNFTTSFSEIKYNCYYGINFEKIDIILNDSQFNSKLFKCSLSRIAFFITNTTDERDSLIIPDAMKNYEHFYVSTNPSSNHKADLEYSKSMFNLTSRQRNSIIRNHYDIKDFDKETLMVLNDKKMIPFFNNYIFSKNLISIYFQNNNFLKWEPFIEPLPIIINYFSNKNHQFINVFLSSLEKLDFGIDNISRQKNFHSLNINMSESLIENFKAFKNDFDKSQLQNYYLRNTELDKKIVIINYTDCRYIIINRDNFTDHKDQTYTKIMRYQTKKPIEKENKEEIHLEFVNDHKKGNKQVTILGNNVEKIREDDHLDDIILREKKYEGKGKFLLNIEKTSKFYFLIKVDNTSSLKQIDDNFLDDKTNPNLHEILKNFDESILLEGEQIMITDVILNVDKNQKTVILRSNFGIKNELDFKVKMKYILKEEEYVHSNKLLKERIILQPNHVFYIPSTVLNKIHKIKIKPFFNKNIIKTSYGEFYINPNSYKNKINIVNCEFKYAVEEKEEDKHTPYRNPIFDFMNFAVYMKKDFAENDCLHSNIRKRLDSIRLYSKFKGKENQGANKKNLENNLCDFTFILSPLIKFMNALPRTIVIKKRLKNELMKVVNIIPKNVNKKEKMIDKFFDIDFFIKLYSNNLAAEKVIHLEENKNHLLEDQEETGVRRFKDKFTLESKDIPELTNDDKISEIITNLKTDGYRKTLKEGDYISIYEGFYLNENYVENLEYVINIDKLEKDTKISMNNKEMCENYDQKSEEDSDNRYFEAIFEPFNIDIIKNLASAKYEQSKLTYKLNNLQNKKIENIVKKILNSKNKNESLLYSVGFNDKYSLDLYIFCPYLFLNSSDLDLKLEYNNTEYYSELNREVIKNLKSSPDMIGVGSKNKDDILINENDSPCNKNNKQGSPIDLANSPEISSYRLIMFYPEHKKSFKFNITSDSSDEKIKLDIDDLTNLMNNYELPLRDNSDILGRDRTNFSEFNSNPDRESSRAFPKKRDKKSHNIQTHDARRYTRAFSVRGIANDTKEKRINFSVQIMNLTGYLKFSKLIFITPYIYIRNTISKNLYILYFHTKEKNKVTVELLKPGMTKKLYYLNNYFEIFKFSLDDKFQVEEMNLYSGMVKFIPNTEFYIKVGDKENINIQHLLHIKVIRQFSFLYVVIKEKNNNNEFPYCIVNNLNRPIKYKQKELLDKDLKQFYELYYFKHCISERKVEMRMERKKGYKRDDKPLNVHYYSWDEPFMKVNGKCILEIFMFGCKFDIDLDDIHEEVKFSDRIQSNYGDFAKETVIQKGVIRIKERFGINYQEYMYKLYDFGLFIENKQEEEKTEILNNFDFFDKDLKFYRKGNGHIVLRKKFNETEMFCIGDEETNRLAGQIYKSIEKCMEILKSVHIKKYVRDKSIVLEISDTNRTEEDEFIDQKIIFLVNVNNLCLSLIEKNREFFYLWLNELSFGFKKENLNYNNISIKIKDYQIDHFLEDAYYPILLAPLIDKSLQSGDYWSMNIEVYNFNPSTNFYQIDNILINITSFDLRLEYKIIEKLQNFFKHFNSNNVCLQKESTYQKSITSIHNIIQKIDFCKFMDESKLKSYENIILIKQMLIQEIKCCFSLKFDNIDMFLEGRAFLLLKPLVEELGLKIINMDSILFTFYHYMKYNVFQSLDEFLSHLSKFYYDLLMTELVKSLGGISSIASMQLMDNLRNNIIMLGVPGMNGEKISGIQFVNHQFQEIAKSSYQNFTQLFSSIFMIMFKILSVFGKFLAQMTYDKTFKQKRSYKINKRIKGILDGFLMALRIFMFGMIYTFTQFYFVPLKWHKKNNICKVPIVITIILIGIILKPIIACNDLCSKICETLAISINDVLGNRVKAPARYVRMIKSNQLELYNPLESYALAISMSIDKNNFFANLDEQHIILPCMMDKRKYVILINTEKLFVFEQKRRRFNVIFQVHFTECKIMQCISDEENVDFMGKKIVFLDALDGSKYIKIYFDGTNRLCWGKKLILWNFTLAQAYEKNSFLLNRYESIKDNIKNKYIENEKNQ